MVDVDAGIEYNRARCVARSFTWFSSNVVCPCVNTGSVPVERHSPRALSPRAHVPRVGNRPSEINNNNNVVRSRDAMLVKMLRCKLQFHSSMILIRKQIVVLKSEFSFVWLRKRPASKQIDVRNYYQLILLKRFLDGQHLSVYVNFGIQISIWLLIYLFDYWSIVFDYWFITVS